MSGEGTSDKGGRPPRTLFSLGREGSRRRRGGGGTDVADPEPPGTDAVTDDVATCASCGNDLVGGAAFCGECGAAVAAASAGGELIDEDLALDEGPAELIDEDLTVEDELEEELVDELVDDLTDDDELVEELAVGDEMAEEDVVDEVLATEAEQAADEDVADEDVADEAVTDEELEVADDLGADELVDDLVDDQADRDVTRFEPDDDTHARSIGAVAAAVTVGGAAVGSGVAEAAEPQSGLAVLADARDQRATATKTDDAPPKDGKRAPVGWIIAGVAAAILIVVGIVALVGGGGGGDGEVASSDQSTTTTRRSESSTTSVSTTTTQPSTTTTEATTTTTAAAAPTAPPPPNTQIVGPQPPGPSTPASLRVAAVTCPGGNSPCTIPVGGTLTVTLVNDGGSPGNYSMSGPGLQGPNGALTGGGSVSVTVRDTVERPDRLATLTISGTGGLQLAVPVLVK
jgi:hypothetical protein